MTDFERSIAREVHALLLSAHPQAADINLTKAAELASAASDTTMRQNDEFREYTFLAIQNARIAITEGASAAVGEQLLLDASRAVEQWVGGEP